MSTNRASRVGWASAARIRTLVGALAIGLLIESCSLLTGPDVQQLRVRNAGSIPIDSLHISFAQDHVEFGSVPGGAMTGYVAVPDGVYRYGAYGYKYEGSWHGNLVYDFMGEVPMEGDRFTYNVRIVLQPDGQPTLEAVASRDP